MRIRLPFAIRLDAPRFYAGALFVGLLVLALAVLAALVSFHFRGLANPYEHYDARIPIGVATHIREAHWPDTNWARAPLPEMFKYEQYNFSSYNLAFAAFWQIAQLPALQALQLFTSICFAAYVTLLAGFAARTQGLIGGAVVLCGLITTPLLVQDSFYGRPEAFFTLLTAAVLVLSSTNRRWTQLSACGLAGFAIACKISFVPFAVAAIVSPLVFLGKEGWRRAALGLAACAIGFSVGAPGALIEPGSFLNGLHFLQQQYASFHSPYGSPNPGLWQQAWHAFGYFVGTLRGATLLLLAGGTVAFAFETLRTNNDPARKASERHMLLFLIVTAVTIIAFCTERTFFERNVSHAMAVAWLPAGWMAERIARSIRNDLPAWTARIGLAVILAWSLVPMAGLSRTVAQMITSPEDNPVMQASAPIEPQIKRRFPGAPIVLKYAYVAQETRDRLCEVLAEAKEDTIVKLATQRYPEVGPPAVDPRITLIAAAPGPFERIPVSTLHVYHAARGEYYLLRPLAPVSPGETGCEPPSPPAVVAQ